MDKNSPRVLITLGQDYLNRKPVEMSYAVSFTVPWQLLFQQAKKNELRVSRSSVDLM